LGGAYGHACPRGGPNAIPAARTAAPEAGGPRCRDELELELAHTFAFLGLEPVGPPALLRQRVKVTRPGARPQLDGRILDELRRAYREDAEPLFDAFPELDATLWTTLAS
jgi:hypothetical protein